MAGDHAGCQNQGKSPAKLNQGDGDGDRPPPCRFDRPSHVGRTSDV